MSAPLSKKRKKKKERVLEPYLVVYKYHLKIRKYGTVLTITLKKDLENIQQIIFFC